MPYKLLWNRWTSVCKKLSHCHLPAQWKDEDLYTHLGFRVPRKQDGSASLASATPTTVFIQESVVLPEGANELDPLALDSSSFP